LSDIDLHDVERVLVTMLRHHGDVLLASPVFSVLKNHFPHLEVDALVYADTSPMLINHPAIAEIHCVDRRWRTQGLLPQARGMGALFRRLSCRRYDLSIHLTVHWLGAWLNRLLRPRYALVPDFRKAKRSGRLWRGSFTHFYPYLAGAHKHVVEKNLDALRFMGIVPGEAESRLVLRPVEAAFTRARQLLSQAGLEEGRFILAHPPSRWLFKCWREESVAEVLDHLASAGWPLVLTAAPDRMELEMIERILGFCRIARPLNLAGKLELQELAALIDLAALHFGVDSVPMHMAAAMQTPSVALFGPSEAAEWGPWMSPHRVISSRDFPRPPGEVIADPTYRHNLSNIPVEAVIRAVDEMLPTRL
jgi:heptosyltransferase-3